VTNGRLLNAALSAAVVAHPQRLDNLIAAGRKEYVANTLIGRDGGPPLWRRRRRCRRRARWRNQSRISVMAHPPGIKRHIAKTRQSRWLYVESDRAEGRPPEAVLEERLCVDLTRLTRRQGMTAVVTDAFSRSPLPCPSRPFIRPILKARSGSTPAVSGAGLSALHCSGSRAGKRVAKKAPAKKIAQKGGAS